MNSEKIVTVQDIDRITERYEVRDVDGFLIGEKAGKSDYRKPEIDRHGIRRFDKWASAESRRYKGNPPWLKAEVQRLEVGAGYVLHIIVRRKEDERS